MLNVILIFVAGLVLATRAHAEDPAMAALACFSGSWNQHDMRAFGQCFATDADFVNVTTQWWKGRVSLERNHAYLHGTIESSDREGITVPPEAHGIFKHTSLTFMSSETRFLRDDLALVHAAWQIAGDVRTSEQRKGLMTLVLAKNDGSWRIAAVQNTEANRNVR